MNFIEEPTFYQINIHDDGHAKIKWFRYSGKN